MPSYPASPPSSSFASSSSSSSSSPSSRSCSTSPNDAGGDDKVPPPDAETSNSARRRRKLLEEDDGGGNPQKNQVDDRDEGGDDDREEGGIRINAAYAREYDTRKRREELAKHRKQGSLERGNGEGDGSSSSESEDEEGELLTPEMDMKIIKTIQALKRGDERVYDRSVDFFVGRGDGGNGDIGGRGGDKKTEKVKRYKDVVREQILEKMDEDEEGGDRGGDDDVGGDGDGGYSTLAYDQEQREIRRAFLDSTRDGDGDGSDSHSDNDDDDGWIRPKAKRFVQPSLAAGHEGDKEARRLWEEELRNSETKKNGAGNVRGGNEDCRGRSPLIDPKGEIADGEAFLMEFMTHRKWMENDNYLAKDKLGLQQDAAREDGAAGGNDDDQSLEDLERTDDFESRYNFRFEEAASVAIGCNGSSGAAHSIVHYARASTSNTGDTLRRKDESRRQMRLARKERKEAERRAKEETLKRLKNARREELEDRMEKVRSVLGYGKGAEGDVQGLGTAVAGGLGIAEEEMILKLMEGEYDPEKFEKVMNVAYGDQYYSKEDSMWKSDGDVKRDLMQADGDDTGVDIVDVHMYEDDVKNENEENYEHEYNIDEGDGEEDRCEEGSETEVAMVAATSAMDRKLQSKLQDELYKLDYEDIIADMPTRFKYRSVPRNDYGITAEEVLLARDSTLKQFVSLKKMAPYRNDGETWNGAEGEYRPGTKRRKRFRQMLKAERKSIEEGAKGNSSGSAEGGVGVNGVTGDDGTENEANKKKRRRQKKGKRKNNDIGTSNNDNEAGKTGNKEPEEVTEAVDESGQIAKKRRRRKKNGRNAATGDRDVSSKYDIVNTGNNAEPEPAKKDGILNNDVGEVNERAGTKSAPQQVVGGSESKKGDSESKKAKMNRKRERKKDKAKHGNLQQQNGFDHVGKKKKKKVAGAALEGVSAARLAAYGI